MGWMKNSKNREVFKFAWYIIVPIAFVAVIDMPGVSNWIVNRYKYVVYPEFDHDTSHKDALLREREAAMKAEIARRVAQREARQAAAAEAAAAESKAATEEAE